MTFFSFFIYIHIYLANIPWENEKMMKEEGKNESKIYINYWWSVIAMLWLLYASC